MKLLKIAWLLAIACSPIFAGCKKDKTDEEQLPPITQTGANTFGCLINGKIYTPKGFEQNKPNFRVIVDPGFNDGSLGIITFNKDDNHTSNVSFGSDSIRQIGNYPVYLNSRSSFNYSQEVNGNQVCLTIGKHTSSASGFISITRYDLTNRIISGEFEFHFSNPDCGIGEPIHITQGRFDKKF